MSTYTATIEFELPNGENIDAASAAALLGERLYTESVEFRITRLSVIEQ